MLVAPALPQRALGSAVFVAALALAVGPTEGLAAEQTDAAGEEDDWGDVEEAEVAVSEKAGGAKGFGAFVGYFHSATVHMPLAWLILVFLLEAFRFLTRREEFEKPGFWLLGLTLLSFLPAIVTGLVRADQLSAGAGEMADAELHRNIMFGVLAIVVAAWFMSWRGWSRTNGPRRLVFVGLLALATLLVGFGGHLGGEMVFGEPPSPF